MDIIPVILSGGSGTRLWPLSREQYPKQLLALTSERTMLQDTALRLDGLPGTLPLAAEPIVVCNDEYRFITAEQLRAVGKGSHYIVLEPVGRNTAPALTLAAMIAQERSGDAVLVVMPADHVIRDGAAYCAAIERGLPSAEAGAMVTFGIVPSRAETGYGYIRKGTAGEAGVCPIEAFVEKPSREVAESYVASGEYLWNSGIFMMRASVWMQAVAHFAPAMAAACQEAVASGSRDADFIRVGLEAFQACPSDSIDYAVMEKLAQAPELGIPGRVVPMDPEWSDVGAWDALWDVSERDPAGNIGRGDVLFEDSHDSLVFAENRLVACLGTDNLVVVETQDAVMVARKDRTQDVKKLVARLKGESRSEAVTHRKVHRPWGCYDSVDAGERFQVKRIVVKPGASLSLQMHHHRAEHWIVVHGTAKVTRGDESFLLSENQSTYIPLGVTHRLENPGKLPLEIIEVQSGSYLGEDDIVRFQDTYGRG
ncbi:MAG: mannose-1-phosphate guanylyltransferase/mannose-6-phosphate isomerase [Zoogloeaceae bacterium]|nr:mannose-1-phosphate guanylyltransferase/mannose-6-phosphate isomerase [Zoogloeaceae bacterium]